MTKEDFKGKLISGAISYDQKKNPPKDVSLIAQNIRRESEVLSGLNIIDILHNITEISRSETDDAIQLQTLLRSSLNTTLPLSVYDNNETNYPGDHRILGLADQDGAVVVVIGVDIFNHLPSVQIASRYDTRMPILGAYWNTPGGQQIGPLSQDHPYMKIIKDDLVRDGAIAYKSYGWRNSDEVVNGIISFLGAKGASIQRRPEAGSLVLALDKYPMRGVDPHHDIFEKFNLDLA